MTTINDVSDTSFWVAHYRAIETARPDAIFKDPFAARLVGERGKKIAEAMPKIGRYTAWSVISRTVIIDRFITQAIKEGVDAVVNLGCGLDTRPYRMSLPADFDWYEVDYQRIIDYKTEKLKGEKPVCRLTRLSVDLADDAARRHLLATVAPQAKKILVLTEGVLPYLKPEQVATLGADLLAQPRIAYWVAEYFHRRVYKFLKEAVKTRMKNSPFVFFPDDWFAFFENIGWKKKEVRYGWEIAKEFGRKPPGPWFMPLVLLIMSKAQKEELGRMVGYTIFERK